MGVAEDRLFTILAGTHATKRDAMEDGKDPQPEICKMLVVLVDVLELDELVLLLLVDVVVETVVVLLVLICVLVVVVGMVCGFEFGPESVCTEYPLVS